MKPSDKLRLIYWYFRRDSEPYKTLWLVDFRLKNLPCNAPGIIDIEDWQVEYISISDLRSMWRYQFGRRHNDFYTSSHSPRILDCGANIGVSVLRYKQLYPESTITAFEPHPDICDVLRRNVTRNQLTGVNVVEAAIWNSSGVADFTMSSLNTQSSHLELISAEQKADSIPVTAVWLGDYLNVSVDFLKLDIEGAELSVLQSCEHLLSNVKQLMVEVHYNIDEPQVLVELLKLLSDAGFNIALYQDIQSPPTHVHYVRDPKANFDQWIIVWAWFKQLA
jgi:FkbM family methyltransferase